MVRFVRYCSCGCLIELQEIALETAEVLGKAWARVHLGPGHQRLASDAKVFESTLADIEQLAVEAAVRRRPTGRPS